jgi:hypothetical protein
MDFRRTMSGWNSFRLTALRIVVLALLLAAPAAWAAPMNAATLPLEDAIKIPDQTLGYQKSVDLSLPALPAKPGKIIVLRFKMVSYCDTLGGCNSNAAIRLNGAPIGRYTAGGDERMVGRSAMFEFTHYGDYKDPFPVFSGPNMVILFAPDVKTGDASTKDGLGATFALNV